MLATLLYRALCHDLNEVGAVVGRSVDVADQSVGGDPDAVEGGRRPVSLQRSLLRSQAIFAWCVSDLRLEIPRRLYPVFDEIAGRQMWSKRQSRVKYRTSSRWTIRSKCLQSYFGEIDCLTTNMSVWVDNEPFPVAIFTAFNAVVTAWHITDWLWQSSKERRQVLAKSISVHLRGNRYGHQEGP